MFVSRKCILLPTQVQRITSCDTAQPTSSVPNHDRRNEGVAPCLTWGALPYRFSAGTIPKECLGTWTSGGDICWETCLGSAHEWTDLLDTFLGRDYWHPCSLTPLLGVLDGGRPSQSRERTGVPNTHPLGSVDRPGTSPTLSAPMVPKEPIRTGMGLYRAFLSTSGVER